MSALYYILFLVISFIAIDFFAEGILNGFV